MILPGKILIGPIYNCPRMLGGWLGHPDLKVFVTDPEKAGSGYDLVYDEREDTFQDLMQRLPADWQPDWIIWWDLVFQGLPVGIEDSPWPLIAMAGDWNLGWSTLEHYASVFDLLIADQPLHQRLQRRGLGHSIYVPCYSFLPDLHRPLPQAEKRYDLTFIGNLNFCVHHRRSQYLQRLALLARQYRVCIANGIFGRDYARLLAQSRIIVNHSVRGEMNMRAYEAPACGALLMMEADNCEVAEFLRDGESCVLYNMENFEARIHWYLSHEEQRKRIAQAGCDQIQHYTYTRHLEKIFQYLPGLKRQCISVLPVEERILRRWKQWYTSGSLPHWSNLIGELQTFKPVETPRVLNACIALWLDAAFRFFESEQFEMAEQCRVYARGLLLRLTDDRPNHWLVCYLWAWFYLAEGAPSQAVVYFQRACQALAFFSPQELHLFSDFMLPFGFFQHFQVEWERILAAVSDLTQRARACQQLLHWQMLFQIGEIKSTQNLASEALSYWRQALAIRPDLGIVDFRVGLLLQADQPDQALVSFRAAAEKGVLLTELWQAHVNLAFQQRYWQEACDVAFKGAVLLQANQKMRDIHLELKAFAELSRAFICLETDSLQAVFACLGSDFHPLWLRILPELKRLQPEVAALNNPWALNWVSDEPRAELPSDTGVYWSAAPSALTIGRSWDVAEIIVSPAEWPYCFLKPIEFAPVVLEEIGAMNLLLLVPDWEFPELEAWLQACIRVFEQVPEAHFFLWMTTASVPMPAHLVENWPCPEAMSWTLLGAEHLSLAESGGVLRQMQGVLGAPVGWQDYLLNWALALEIPVGLIGSQPQAIFDDAELWLQPEALMTWWHEKRPDLTCWEQHARRLKTNGDTQVLSDRLWNLRQLLFERSTQI